MRKRAVAKTLARPRPAASPLPALALFFTVSLMLWFGWWAFWSVR